jgi:hypothetical protein
MLMAKLLHPFFQLGDLFLAMFDTTLKQNDFSVAVPVDIPHNFLRFELLFGLTVSIYIVFDFLETLVALTHPSLCYHPLLGFDSPRIQIHQVGQVPYHASPIVLLLSYARVVSEV